MDGDGVANTGASLAANAPGTIPPGTGSGASGAGDGAEANERDDAPAFTASRPPSAVNAPPSGILNSDQRTTVPALPARCVLLHDTLCRALKNRPVVILAAVQTTALISDGVTTRQYLQRGYTEVDPLTRILIGSKPTWGRMAPLGAVQVVAGMWLAERMASSRHVWVRRFWWLPQMLGTAGNAAATAHNVALH
jgi:hypothetical protein